MSTSPQDPIRTRTSKRTRLALAGVTFAAASMVAVPLAAASTTADPPAPSTTTSSATRLDKARARCEDMVSRRQTRLTKDLSLVHDATGAPEADRATLTGQLEDAQKTLSQAAGPIHSAKTAAELRDACKGAIENTRVFVLDGPKVRSVVATSRLAKVDARAQQADGRFAKALARAEKRGVSPDAIADAKAKAADAKSALADAHTKIDGLDATLLPIQPAQVNDHSADATLKDAKARLQAAAADAKQIHADLSAVAKDLRAPRR
jgi:hypothetical protein